MRFATLLGLTIVVGITASCNPSDDISTAGSTSANGGDQGVALMQVSRDWAKAAATGDVDRIVSYFADDAIMLEPDRPALAGKPAIRGMVAASMKIPKFSITWEPERASISQSGDMGYLIEHNRVTFADSTGKVQTVFGKGVTIWKKDASGNWKCVVDTWNTAPTETVFPVKA